MINRKYIDDSTIQFEDFVSSSADNRIGARVEVSMGGPYTAKTFVISGRQRHVSNPEMVTLTAKAVVTLGMLEADPVACVVKRCGTVVANIVHDEVCELFYIGENLADPKSLCTVAENLESALKQYAA